MTLFLSNKSEYNFLLPVQNKDKIIHKHLRKYATTDCSKVPQEDQKELYNEPP